MTPHSICLVEIPWVKGKDKYGIKLTAGDELTDRAIDRVTDNGASSGVGCVNSATNGQGVRISE